MAVALLLPGSASAWQIDPDLLQACPILGPVIMLAVQDAESPEGVDCFNRGPLDNGIDPSEFTQADNGPMIEVEDLPDGVFGLYRRFTHPNTVFLDEDLKIDAQSGDAAALEVLVATLVHETAHWVDHTVDGGADTPGEEGNAMEEWIYGFVKWIENVDGIELSCAQSPPGTLALAIDPLQPVYGPGEPVLVEVTLTNTSPATVAVIDRFFLDGNYISFALSGPGSEPVPYLGNKRKLGLLPETLIDLGPGQQLQRVVALDAPEEGHGELAPGTYSASATYTLPNVGCPLLGHDLFLGSVSSAPVQFAVVPETAAVPVLPGGAAIGLGALLLGVLCALPVRARAAALRSR